MSKVSAYGFTNTTASTHTLAPVALGLVSNYALAEEDANNAILNNKTAPVDAEELVTFRSRAIETVNTSLKVQNPAKVKGGIQYQVQVEAVRTTTDTADSTFRVDEPIVALLTIRHPKSSNFTASAVEEIIKRLVGCLYKADGTSRIDDLMRGAERPIVD